VGRIEHPSEGRSRSGGPGGLPDEAAIRVTPAMEGEISQHVWSIQEIVAIAAVGNEAVAA
jgi:hypothetical protein